MVYNRILTLLLIVSLTHNAYAQNSEIGQWQSHLPYNTATSVATDGVMMYVGGKYGFYTLSIASDEVTKYSKVNGMSDLGVQKIAYDDVTGTVIIAYENSNIDLFKNGSFYNIPELALKTVNSSKKINHIYTEGGLAYLSTDQGIIVLNLSQNEVLESYTFTKNSEVIPVKSLNAEQGFFYAATGNGLYKANKNSKTLQAFQTWQPLDTTRSFVASTAHSGRVFVAKPDTLFAVENDTLRGIYGQPDSFIRSLDNDLAGIWIIEYYDTTFSSRLLRMAGDYSFTDTINIVGVVNEVVATPTSDSSKWIAVENNGLKRRAGKGDPFGTNTPEGPSGASSFDIYVNDKDLIVAHGGYDDLFRPLNSGDGFSVYKEGEWESYQIFGYPPFGDSVTDIAHILRGPDDAIYAGSQTSGLFILKPDGSYEYYKQNSFIDPSSTGSSLYRVSGLAFDNDGVLWATVFGGQPSELVARTTDGQWYQYRVVLPFNRSIPNAAIYLEVDDANQKWYSAPGDGGVIVYDDNHTPALKTDDRYRQLLAGEGSGGLPNSTVYSIAKDKDGAMWLGTADGIGIVNCPSQVIEGQCEAEKRIVQFDQFAGFLFQNEQVRTIAVDGANRKWIGTNNGVWLISENGDEIIERFTEDNSPLPSNFIQKIAVDPATGDVYIGTERGLMSYRGAAIDGGEENSDLIVYPNPVPSGYSGTIAIKGFVENADVRITDVSGQLVYRTQALGGQAVWNGLDYTGRRPQSGVYLIFGTNKDGTQTVKGKMVFME